MNFQPWLEIILVLFGSYLTVRVELATIKEQIKAQASRSDGLEKRIERLEGEYFRAD